MYRVGKAINIVIVGSGAIGLYLYNVLNVKGNYIYFYDYRNQDLATQYSILINQKSNFIEILRSTELKPSPDLIIVCTKSFDVNEELIDILIKSNAEIVFIQNGVTLFLKHQGTSENFHFGTISGIQAELIQSKLSVLAENCTLVVKKAKNDKFLKKLKFEMLKNNFNIEIKTDYNKIILEKFIRWLTISSLISFHKLPLGRTLVVTSEKEIRRTIDEITEFIEIEFKVKISADETIKKINSLPIELLTSAYRDFILGRKNEMTIELEKTIISLEFNGRSAKNLKRLHRVLTNGE